MRPLPRSSADIWRGVCLKKIYAVKIAKNMATAPNPTAANNARANGSSSIAAAVLNTIRLNITPPTAMGV
jgi:hypothetical protein